MLECQNKHLCLWSDLKKHPQGWLLPWFLFIAPVLSLTLSLRPWLMDVSGMMGHHGTGFGWRWVCSTVMWPQQMAQLSIRAGSPAVCSPASCSAATKYHRGSVKEGEGREGGREKSQTGEKESRSERGMMWWRDKEKMKAEEVLQTEVMLMKSEQRMWGLVLLITFYIIFPPPPLSVTKLKS